MWLRLKPRRIRSRRLDEGRRRKEGREMSAPAGAATWVARHNGEFVGYAEGRRQFAERSDVAAAAAAEN